MMECCYGLCIVFKEKYGYVLLLGIIGYVDMEN